MIGVEQWRASIGLYHPCSHRKPSRISGERQLALTPFYHLIVAILLALTLAKVLVCCALIVIWIWINGYSLLKGGLTRIIASKKRTSGAQLLVYVCVIGLAVSDANSGCLERSAKAMAILLIMAGDVEENPGPIGQRDLKTVSKYLCDLSQSNLKSLGLALGLYLTTIRDYGSVTLTEFRQNLICDWIIGKDDVKEYGGATWSSLVTALRDEEVNQNGIADRIEAEQIKGHQERADEFTKKDTERCTLSPPPAKQLKPSPSDIKTQHSSQIPPQPPHPQPSQLPPQPSYSHPQPPHNPSHPCSHPEHQPLQQIEQTLPPPAKQPRHIQPPPHSVAHYADYLRHFYQTSKLPVNNKWPPTPSKRYINLAIIGREEVSSEEMKKFQTATIHGDINDILKTKAPINLQNILDSKPEEKLQCVLVEGAPGVGKTTLAWEISNRWGKGELFQQYTMVMLLRLRDGTVQNSTCIADLIFHEDKQEISSYLMYTWGKDTLIILEGLDELPQHLLTQPSIFTHLLAGTILPRATIFITSRPSATVQLWKNWKERVSKHIEILGFTPQNITEYIESVVPSKELSGFNNYLSMNSHIKTMMYVPIHAAIVVEVYRCCQRSHKPLPTTITDLYTSLAQTILLRYLDSHPNYKGNYTILQQFTDLPSPVYQDFYKLTEIAYNGVLRQQLIFHDQHQEIEHFGFMDAVTELFPNQCSVSYSYNFLHLSVQEYLASYYVSLMCTHEQEQLLSKMCEKQYLKNMGQFLAGLTQFKSMDRIIVKTIIVGECRKESDGSLELSPYALQLLHECRYANIIDDHPSYSYTLGSYSKPFEYSVLGHCIANSSYRWRLHLLEINYSDDDCMQDRIDLFIQALKSNNNPGYTIESISYRYCVLDCIKYFIVEMPQYALQQLQELELAECDKENFESLLQCMTEHILSPISALYILRIDDTDISASGATTIATALHSNSTLTQLDIRANNISESGTTAIATALQSNSTLTQLDISVNNISDSGATAIATALHSNSTLTQLNISANNISTSGATAIATALHSNSTLTQLSIAGNNISDSGATAIATALHSNSSYSTLTQLDISVNSISASGATAIATALHSNSTLTQLGIMRNNISDSGATAIATALHSNSTLTWLNIAGNNISDSGATAIATALHSNSTLTQLDIGHNNISDSGATAIATALHSNSTLTHLYIGHNNISDSGATAIATALHSNSTLTQLDIYSNNISDIGAITFSDLFLINKTLQCVNLLGNKNIVNKDGIVRDKNQLLL